MPPLLTKQYKIITPTKFNGEELIMKEKLLMMNNSKSISQNQMKKYNTQQLLFLFMKLISLIILTKSPSLSDGTELFLLPLLSTPNLQKTLNLQLPLFQDNSNQNKTHGGTIDGTLTQQELIPTEITLELSKVNTLEKLSKQNQDTPKLKSLMKLLDFKSLFKLMML